MSEEVNAESRSQIILVNPPSGSVAVINAGLQGPPGADGAIFGDSFWAYDGATLSPDPATTTPLNFLSVQTTDVTSGTAALTVSSNSGSEGVGLSGTFDGSHTADFGINADNASASVFFDAVGADNSADLRVSAQDGAAATVALEAVEGVALGKLQLDGAGSFSLTADDGTTQPSVVGSGGSLYHTLTDGSTSSVLAQDLTTTDVYWSDGTSENHIVADVVGARLDAAAAGGGTAFINANADGSFSLTADDGTYVGIIDFTDTLANAITAQVTTTDHEGRVIVGAYGVIADSTATGGNSASFQLDSQGSTGFTLACATSGAETAVVATAAGELRFSGLVAAPNSAHLNASTFSLWLDATPGATKLMVKAKDSGGTVRTAAIALT